MQEVQVPTRELLSERQTLKRNQTLKFTTRLELGKRAKAGEVKGVRILFPGKGPMEDGFQPNQLMITVTPAFSTGYADKAYGTVRKGSKWRASWFIWTWKPQKKNSDPWVWQWHASGHENYSSLELALQEIAKKEGDRTQELEIAESMSIVESWTISPDHVVTGPKTRNGLVKFRESGPITEGVSTAQRAALAAIARATIRSLRKQGFTNIAKELEDIPNYHDPDGILTSKNFGVPGAGVYYGRLSVSDSGNVWVTKGTLAVLIRKGLVELPTPPRKNEFGRVVLTPSGVRALAADYPNLLRESITENISMSDLNKLETFLDDLFAYVGLDIEFTRHFFDRVNDPRNGKPITSDELARIFHKVYERHASKIRGHGSDWQAVIKDLTSKINIPFVLNYDKRKKTMELVSKTVMRKRDFKTPGKTLTVQTNESSTPRLVKATTPAGKPGWRMDGLRDGYVAYAVESVETFKVRHYSKKVYKEFHFNGVGRIGDGKGFGASKVFSSRSDSRNSGGIRAARKDAFNAMEQQIIKWAERHNALAETSRASIAQPFVKAWPYPPKKKTTREKRSFVKMQEGFLDREKSDPDVKAKDPVSGWKIGDVFQMKRRYSKQHFVVLRVNQSRGQPYGEGVWGYSLRMVGPAGFFKFDWKELKKVKPSFHVTQKYANRLRAFAASVGVGADLLDPWLVTAVVQPKARQRNPMDKRKYAMAESENRSDMLAIFDSLKTGETILVSMRATMGMGARMTGTYMPWVVGRRSRKRKVDRSDITLLQPGQRKPNKYNRTVLSKSKSPEGGGYYISAGSGGMSLRLVGIKRPDPGEVRESIDVSLQQSRHGPSYRVHISGSVGGIEINGESNTYHHGIDRLDSRLVYDLLRGRVWRSDGHGKAVSTRIMREVEAAVLQKLQGLGESRMQEVHVNHADLREAEDPRKKAEKQRAKQEKAKTNFQKAQERAREGLQKAMATARERLADQIRNSVS